MIAAIHNLEAGLRFTAHLHNGDLLTARTVLVPSRQPKTGSSPFDWAFSATDALMTKVNGTWKTVQEWSLPAIFWKCEMYNVFESITPGKLVRLSGLENPETEYITAEELVSYFFSFPNFPKMLGVEPIKRAILKAVEQGILGYVPSMTVSSDGTPLVENPSLVSLNRVIPPDELDISGYLLSPSLATQLRTPTLADEELDTTTSQDDSDGDTNQQKTQPDYLGSVSSTDQKTVEEGKKAVEYKSQSSSVKRSVLVDIVNGKQPARHYKLTSTTNKSQIFQLFEVLQALSDKADDMTISIEVRAHTQKEFDTTWIRNAIEEPLDEMDIQASTQLE